MARYETPDLVDLNESAIGYGGSCASGSNASWGCGTGNRATTGCHTGSSAGSACYPGTSGAVNPGT